MKFVLLGIAIILFGIAIISAYSSTGLGYSSGTKIGFGISFLGLLISIGGCFFKSEK
ncbi:hypothetical protein MKY27_07510 [Solibacillus sp. FSL R5-0449]|uniref:hypothetical protein n=1 Tax=Solibacillus sp. FSL R5-0449 TaxID=2921639 RepID=UPI0030CDE7BA